MISVVSKYAARLSCLILLLTANACSVDQTVPADAEPTVPLDAESLLNTHVPLLLNEYKAAGAGIAIIHDGAISWTGYYGEQEPQVPVTRNTVFNTASVAKTVTAETILALVAKNAIDLDEPIYRTVTHPDLSKDTRFEKLTLRLLLSHRAGLLNWPYSYEDGRAAFITEPGSTYSYSGMGVDLAAEFVETKLGIDFEALAFQHVLHRLGVSDMSLGRHEDWMHGRLARPMDTDGEYFNIAQSDGRMSDDNYDGRWSAADDLLTTLDAYTIFLLGVIGSQRQGEETAHLRGTILTSLAGDEVWHCEEAGDLNCADAYGHSIGWMVYRFGDRTVITHGGNDRGENALVLFSAETGNGAVILVNGGNGIFVSTQILDLLGEFPHMAAYYRQLVGKFYNVQLPQQTR